MEIVESVALVLGLQNLRTCAAYENRHADAAFPPRVSQPNPKLEACRIKPGSTDRTHWLEITIKPGALNNIAQGEVICRVSFGTPYVDGLQTIGIPSDPQIAGFVAASQTPVGYDLVSSGIQGGQAISVRPIVVSSTGPL